MTRTCCPQYTIRLDSTQFKPDKKHRQVMNRFNRYLTTGEKPGESSETVTNTKGKGGGKGKGKAESNWIDTLRECQAGHGAREQKHTFRVSQHHDRADDRRNLFLPKPHRRHLSCIRNTKFQYTMINRKKSL